MKTTMQPIIFRPTLFSEARFRNLSLSQFTLFVAILSKVVATLIILPSIANADDKIVSPTLKLGAADKSYGFLVGDISLTNPNDFAIADVVVACMVTAPSGTVLLNYDFTIYDVVKAKAAKTVRAHRFGRWPDQGKSLTCLATGARRS